MWLWWIYGVVVLLVIPVVLILAVRIVRTALEISRYGADILSDARTLAHGLEPAAELATTAELAATLGQGASAYAAAVDRAA